MSALAIISKVRRLQAIRAASLPKATTEVRTTPASTIDLDRFANDFPSFAAKLDIVPKSGIRSKLRPNAIQSAFEISRSGRDIVLKPRQVGLTTWELARDIWYFLTRRGARVVVVCQSMADDSAIKEISEKVRVMLDSLRIELGLTFPVRSKSTTQWVLPERDSSLRIVGAGASEASAKKKGRSGTIHRLHVTELAFYEFARATLNAMLECVPGPEFGTEVVLESTANGAAGLFYEFYQGAKSGKGGYKPSFYPWIDQSEYRTPLEPSEIVEPENEREKELVDKYGVSPEQLKWYRAKVLEKGQDDFDQEYPIDEERCWLTAGRLFFDKERTKSLLTQTREPLETRAVGKEGSFGVLRIWARPEPGQDFLVSVDPSEGVGGDFGAAVIYERVTGSHVATLHGQFGTWEMGRVVVEIAKEFNEALIAVERNNHGHAVLNSILKGQRYRRVFVDGDERPGWNNKQLSRAAALEALHDAHREKVWSSPDRASIAEMLTFIVNDKGKPEAASGAHDDIVMAHAVAWDVLTKPIVDKRRHELYDYDDSDENDA